MPSTLAAAPPPTDASATAWWRERMMWLVVGGPLAVVVASVATAVIAVRGADTVVIERPVRATAPQAATPALQARNHAATPAAPAEANKPR
jgi:uncharacterized protein